MPDSAEDNVACRICMDHKDNYVSLFFHDLSKKVIELADVLVEKDDGLPDSICTECEQDLEKCYEFRLKVQFSDKKFRENIRFSQVEIEECNIKEERFIDDGHSDNMDDKDSVSIDDEHYNDEPEVAPKITEETEEAAPDPLNHVVVVEEKERKIEMSDYPISQDEAMTEEPRVQKMEEVAVDPLVCMKEEEETEIMDVDPNQPDPFGPSSSDNDFEDQEIAILPNDGDIEKKRLQPKQSYLMSSKRKRATNKAKWTKESLVAAIDLVKNGTSMRQAAKLHSIPVTTLHERISKAKTDSPSLGRHSTFTNEQYFCEMGPYKRKTNRQVVTAEQMEEAKRKLQEGKSKRAVARELGMNECTLRKRLKAGTTAVSLGRFRRALTDEMEWELAQYCKDLDNRFYGLTRKQIMKVAFEYAELNNVADRFNKDKKAAGKDWLKGFCQRNKLSVRTPGQCSMARVIGFNKVQVTRFYDNLKVCCQSTKFPAHRKFNVDETGVSTVPNKTPKILTQKGKKTVCKISSAGRGETVTAVCCMGATGIFVPPALIFPQKRMNPLLLKDAPPGTLCLVTETGDMNTDLFMGWLKHFVRHTKPSKEDPVLLIAGNHSAHCSLPAVLYCRDNHVTFVTLPPHASHVIQPLERGFFGPLKSAYTVEVEKWLVQHPGEVVKISDIASIFKRAYSATAKINLAENAFKVTGIEPFDPNIIPEELYAPSTVTHQPQVEAQCPSAD